LDKFEYKVRAEEIKNLIAQGDYAQAAEIADTIDWRRVKSVMMLCTISDLYKINRRYEDARDMLLLAYERRPGGRNICYSLCELSIKTGEFVQAMEYYKEFVQVAPRDPGRYILQYKLYEDQDVSLEERIEVLEELKKHDYREKWAYELAYLYHRVGLGTRCVEECDEMIVWFSEGDYVIKAMELKMLHQPLSPEQQEVYDHRFDQPVEEPVAEQPEESEEVDGQTREFGAVADEDMVSGDTQIYCPIRDEDLEQVNYAEDGYAEEEEAQEETFWEENEIAEEPDELDIQVKTMDVSQYNTMNLQAELAEGLRELLAEEYQEQEAEVQQEEFLAEESLVEEMSVEEPEEEVPAAEEQESVEIEDPVMRSIMEPMIGTDTESLDYPEIDEVNEEDLEPEPEQMEASEVFFGETGEIELEEILKQERTVDEIKRAASEMARAEQMVIEHVVSSPVRASQANAHMTVVEPPKELAHVLSQEADGQISLVVPEKEHVEKQITGQMNIEDILAEWERWKKENEAKNKEEVRQRVLQQTGNMFTEFDMAVRDGLLEQLEKSANEPDEVVVEDVITEADEVEELAEVVEETGAEEMSEEIVSEETEEDVREFVMISEHPAEPVQEEVFEEEVFEEESFTETSEGEYVDETAEYAEETTEFAEEYVEGTDEVAAEIGQEAESEEYQEEVAEEILDAVSEEMVEEPDAVEETVAEVAESQQASDQVAAAAVRPMSPEECALYNEYIQHESTQEQIVRAVDSITLAAYTGNVIITGEAGIDVLELAKSMIREVQSMDNNFSGKVAKISGQGLNRKNVADTLNQLQNGALIIQNACDLDDKTAQDLNKALQNENLGIVVVMTDDVKIMNRFLTDKQYLLDVFTSRVDVKALTTKMLVEYGENYAKEQEYSIDELGRLALHTSIENRQTLEHAVTTTEVQEIVNNAIRRANRKTMGHFFSILLAKRYDEEDMIIITEKDFV